MKRQAIVRLHALPGRFDRPAPLLRRNVAQSARAGASIILGTELTSKARGRAFNYPGFTSTRDSDGWRGEVAILAQDSVWEIEREKLALLGPDLGPGGPVVASIALLRHKATNIRFMPSIAHLPATVESNWRTGPRAKAHRDAVDEWRQVHLDWRREFHPDAELAWADWNLNLHRKWVQDWIDQAWPALTVPRDEIIPKGATHKGGRLIDWPVRKGIRIDAWRIEKPAWSVSDHSDSRIRGTITVNR